MSLPSLPKASRRVSVSKNALRLNVLRLGEAVASVKQRVREGADDFGLCEGGLFPKFVLCLAMCRHLQGLGQKRGKKTTPAKIASEGHQPIHRRQAVNPVTHLTFLICESTNQARQPAPRRYRAEVSVWFRKLAPVNGPMAGGLRVGALVRERRVLQASSRRHSGNVDQELRIPTSS